jgi:hypothetical protein
LARSPAPVRRRGGASSSSAPSPRLLASWPLWRWSGTRPRVPAAVWMWSVPLCCRWIDRCSAGLQPGSHLGLGVGLGTWRRTGRHPVRGRVVALGADGRSPPHQHPASGTPRHADSVRTHLSGRGRHLRDADRNHPPGPGADQEGVRLRLLDPTSGVVCDPAGARLACWPPHHPAPRPARADRRGAGPRLGQSLTIGHTVLPSLAAFRWGFALSGLAAARAAARCLPRARQRRARTFPGERVERSLAPAAMEQKAT